MKLPHCGVEITEFLSHTFLTKILWNQQFYTVDDSKFPVYSTVNGEFWIVDPVLKKLIKRWFHEIYFSVCGVEKLEIYSHQKKFRQINSLVISLFSNTVTFTKFLPKICESKFPFLNNTLCVERRFV